MLFVLSLRRRMVMHPFVLTNTLGLFDADAEVHHDDQKSPTGELLAHKSPVLGDIVRKGMCSSSFSFKKGKETASSIVLLWLPVLQ